MTPNLPRGHHTLSAQQRHRHAVAYSSTTPTQAETYHRVRPGYDARVLDFFLSDTGSSGTKSPRRALDIGAGTGLFTHTLVQRGFEVTAVEPSVHMARVLAENLPSVRVLTTPVEDLPAQIRRETQQVTFDLITVAQAWHWLDAAELGTFVAGLLGNGGGLGIVHHQLDTSIAWVHRLSRIMHAGDVTPVYQPPRLGPTFSPPQGRWWYWEDELLVAELHELMTTRSFYLRATEHQRHRMHANLSWYLTHYLGHQEHEPLRIPYITSAWRSRPHNIQANSP